MTQGNSAGVTRVGAVMSEITARILDRRLVTGARLPSIRSFAQAMSVSKSTVVEAYQRLAAEGVVSPRAGSGFYVADRAAPRRVEPVAPAIERAVDPYWLTFQALETADDALKPGSGWLPVDWMPQKTIQTALRDVARSSPIDRVAYDAPRGHAGLRQQIARRLATTGLDVDGEQVLLTESGSQAVDLACRLLIQPGDKVLVDDPCYFNFRALLAAHRAEIVAVPYTPAGPDIEAFATILQTHKPRLYVTNCGCHNPTGATLSPVTAHRLMRLAEHHGLYIIEDDVFVDLEHEPAVRLAALDGLNRVIAVGSFSKTVSAALRCGYVAARPDWLESLVPLKLATYYGNSRIAAAFVHRVLTDGGYRRHCETTRTKLAAAMSLTLDRLRACGLEPWLEPRAGTYVWARLPRGIEAAPVARAALAQGVVLAPGNVFSNSAAMSGFMRFNVARCAEPKIFEVLAAAIAASA